MHKFEEQINQWRAELEVSHGLAPEKIDEQTEQLRQNLEAVSALALSTEEKFALAKYRLRNAVDTGSGSNEEVDHNYGLGELALMLGGYLLFGLFFSVLQFIAVPLTSINGFMQVSPGLAYIVYMLSSAVLISAFVYGIWRFAQTDSVARLFGYKSQKPNSAFTIAKNAVAIYLILAIQQIVSAFAMHSVMISGISHAELYIGFNNRAISFSGYASLFLPTILFIFLMWIQHIKYPRNERPADPTHA